MSSYYPQPLSAFAETVRDNEELFYRTFPAAKLSAQGGVGAYQECSPFSSTVSFVFDPHRTAYESGLSSDGGYVAVAAFLETPAALQSAPEATHPSYTTVQTSIAGLHYNYPALSPNPQQQQQPFAPNFHYQSLPQNQPQLQVPHYPSTTSFLSYPEVQSAPTTTLPPRQATYYNPAEQHINPEQRQHPVVVPEYPYTLPHIQSHPQVSLPHHHQVVAAPSSQPYIIQSPVEAFVSSPPTYNPDTQSDLGSSPRSEIDDFQEPIVRPRHSLYPVNHALKAEFIEHYPTDDAHVTPPLPPAATVIANAAASSSSIASAASAGGSPSAAGPSRTSRPRQHDAHHTHYTPRHARSLSHNTSAAPVSKKAPLRGMSASSIWSDSQLGSSGSVMSCGGGSSGVGGPSSSQSSTTPMRLSPLPSKRTLEKKPPLACLFCRGRKIACGPPLPGSTDKTCNQCQRRQLNCEYPSESRRGMRKKKNDPDDAPETTKELPAGAAADATDTEPVPLPTL